MATGNALEIKVQALEDSINESQQAIRKLAGENSNLLAMIAKMTDDLNKLKVDGLNLRQAVESNQKKQTGVNRYE